MTCFCLNYINNIFTSDVFNFKLFDTGGPPVRSPPVGRISLQDCFEI